jgi:hypothetical protein
MEYYRANNIIPNQYPSASINTNKLIVINPIPNSSASRKRNGPKTIVVEKRRKDILSSISPSSSQCNGDQNIKSLLDLFAQDPSPTHKIHQVQAYEGRGRPISNSKNGNVTDNMILVPAENCAYKKHKTEDRIQRLFIFSDFEHNKGHEYAYYTRSKDQGATLHGFYCMECSTIRKKREFDALIRVERNGEETFMSKPHVSGCQPRDNNDRYTVKVANPAEMNSNNSQNTNGTPSLAAMNEFSIQNMIRTTIQESSQQLITSMLEQIRTIVREEVATQLQQINNNFQPNY